MSDERHHNRTVRLAFLWLLAFIAVAMSIADRMYSPLAAIACLAIGVMIGLKLAEGRRYHVKSHTHQHGEHGI